MLTCPSRLRRKGARAGPLLRNLVCPNASLGESGVRPQLQNRGKYDFFTDLRNLGGTGRKRGVVTHISKSSYRRLTFPDTALLSSQGVIPMVFEHSGGRDFDLPRHSHYSGVIPMVFEHSGPGSESRGALGILSQQSQIFRSSSSTARPVESNPVHRPDVRVECSLLMFLTPEQHGGRRRRAIPIRAVKKFSPLPRLPLSRS